MMKTIVGTAAFAAVILNTEARMVKVHQERKALAEETSVGSGRRMKDTFCSTPVQKGKVVFPDSLVGRAQINYEMYSGYVNITSSPDYLFYWFFGAQQNADTAPLIIWTNGGPGCTAMEGATTEHGPLNLLEIKEACYNAGATSKCDWTYQFSKNHYAWNNHANVVYLDQPKNVGYSFGYGQETSSSKESGEEFVTFYNNWIKLFPEFKGRKLIIAGESYGGHYIPAWSEAILDYNEQNPSSAIPLSGIVIGNGCTNDTVQNTEQFVTFQHNENLIPATANPKTQGTAYAQMESYLGYTANYYDYRQEAVQCSACYSYNYTAWSYWFLQSEVLTALNVCGDAGNDAFAGSAGGCINMGAFDAHDNFDYSAALGRALDLNIPVTLYYGKTDTACNYQGGIALGESIPFKSSSQYNAAPLAAWNLGGVEAGQSKSVGGLTLVLVEDAGHMVPLNQPAASAQIIEGVLNQVTSSKK